MHQIEREPAAGPTIAQCVELAQGFDRLVEDAVAALRIGLRRSEVGQRCHHLHLIGREEVGEIGMRLEQQDAQIAAIHHVAPERAGAFHYPAEARIQLGCAAGDVHDRDIGLFQGGHAQLGGLARHLLGAVGPGIDMAMAAGLVAELADIDLEHTDAGGAQRRDAGVGEAIVEAAPGGGAGQDIELMLAGRERGAARGEGSGGS